MKQRMMCDGSSNNAPESCRFKFSARGLLSKLLVFCDFPQLVDNINSERSKNSILVQDVNHANPCEFSKEMRYCCDWESVQQGWNINICIYNKNTNTIKRNDVCMSKISKGSIRDIVPRCLIEPRYKSRAIESLYVDITVLAVSSWTQPQKV